MVATQQQVQTRYQTRFQRQPNPNHYFVYWGRAGYTVYGDDAKGNQVELPGRDAKNPDGSPKLGLTVEEIKSRIWDRTELPEAIAKGSLNGKTVGNHRGQRGRNEIALIGHIGNAVFEFTAGAFLGISAGMTYRPVGAGTELNLDTVGDAEASVAEAGVDF